jgi:hypothetical protein
MERCGRLTPKQDHKFLRTVPLLLENAPSVNYRIDVVLVQQILELFSAAISKPWRRDRAPSSSCLRSDVGCDPGGRASTSRAKSKHWKLPPVHHASLGCVHLGHSRRRNC